jgi:hypothetical protein
LLPPPAAGVLASGTVATGSGRFLLYLAIPLGSWLGGALVERLLDALLS